MISKVIGSSTYNLPGSLNSFQLDLYVHLINWKWKYISQEVGYHTYKGEKIAYDAILPERYKSSMEILYFSIRKRLKEHIEKYPFRIHTHFNHMASSQAANINLFLPILTNENADEILRTLKTDFKTLAVDHLDRGFQIEFCDEPFNSLGDKTAMSGTDSDIAIAYFNKQDELCLWLIEHKLTEAEFTQCGGTKSKNRDKGKHLCEKSFSDLLVNKNYCYYHDVRKLNYWNITENNKTFFSNHKSFHECPFKGGSNQLWRNQLLGLSIEKDHRQPYEHVYFSVVKHPRNTYLDKSIAEYKTLVGNTKKFTVLESSDIIEAANNTDDRKLRKWISWYKQLYYL